MLGGRKILEGSVIGLACSCDILLSLKELSIVEPDLGHGMHVDQGAFMELIHDFEIVSLGDEVELLDIESGLFQIVEPELVAAR